MDPKSILAVDMAMAYATEAELKALRKPTAAVLNAIRNDQPRRVAAWAAWSLTIPYEPSCVEAHLQGGMRPIETNMADAIREVLSL
jgi:hypothetical protein